MDLVRKPLIRLGARSLRFFMFVGELGLMLRGAAAASPRMVMVRRGRRLAWENLWYQLYRVGVRSIGVVSLVTICIGAILALQIGPILRTYGAVSQLPTVIGIAMFRELGPLIGAIVLTGFAGASMAAELGTMAVSEEIKALRTHAISPIRFLVLPRVVATVFMTVCLANLSNIMGVTGGMLTAYFTQDISVHEYFTTTFEAVDTYDWLTGLSKAGVFGLLISGLACYLGMNVRGGAEGVGTATTRTVVISIVSLICSDLIFTYVFFQLDF